MENDYRCVKFEGKTYYLTQDAYIDNYDPSGEVRTDSGTRYFASAVDEDGESYMVSWDLLPEYVMYTEDMAALGDTDGLDESWACDWENPVEVVR